MSNRLFINLTLLATLLAFCVIILGAYVRLSNAGLGCPDWPGCYAKIIVADYPGIASNYPDSPLVEHKAWKEMIHRYAAGTLGLLILLLAIMSWTKRHEPGQPVLLPMGLLGLVIFQSLLGMWTVTLKLHPLVVMTHLLGGLATLCLLWILFLKIKIVKKINAHSPLSYLGLAVLILQIALGGWMSANYASLACTDLPTCHGSWWPPMNFKEAFLIWHEIGPDYEWGILDNTARVTIHMMHRMGAIITFVVLGFLGIKNIFSEHKQIRLWSTVLLILLIVQFLLGLSNVFFHLPLPVAVAHNGGAALLLLALIRLINCYKSTGNHTTGNRPQ